MPTQKKKKVCKLCGVEKVETDFQLRRGRRLNQCRTCLGGYKKAWLKADPKRQQHVTERIRKWRAENPDRSRAYGREWHRRNAEKCKEQSKTWREQNRERYNEARRQYNARTVRRRLGLYLKRKYGISIEHYEALLEQQNGCCAICGRQPAAKARLHLDHNASTGVVRGLLCGSCNRALGLMQEKPEALRQAAAYLESYHESAPCEDSVLDDHALAVGSH